MKLILKQSVENLGGVGDLVEVKRGYARNYLLPKGLAVEVSPGAMQQIEARARKDAHAQKEQERSLRSLADQLSATSVTIAAKVNPEGRLFGSVGPKDVAAMLVADGFSRVTPEMLGMPEPFKDLGVYEVAVSLSPEISAVCKVWIVPEE